MLKRIYKTRAKSINRLPEEVADELDAKEARRRASKLVDEADEYLTRTEEE